jgi:hypothetical protein
MLQGEGVNMPEVKALHTSQKIIETVAALLKSQERLLAAYSAALRHRQIGRMNYLNRRMRDTSSLLDSLREIESEFAAERRPPIFVVSSLFLYECFRELTADHNEQFFFLTGPEINGARVLDQRCRFDHLRRTQVGVTGDPKSTHRLLVRLEQFGHHLLGHFHSHPGRGIESTRPSGTDTDYQGGLEKAGYPTLAAIFSRDGFIRFFRLDKNFELQIHGNGVEHVQGQTAIYRLTNID